MPLPRGRPRLPRRRDRGRPQDHGGRSIPGLSQAVRFLGRPEFEGRPAAERAAAALRRLEVAVRARTGRLDVERTVRLRGGGRMRTHLASPLDRDTYAAGCWELATELALRALLRPGMTAVDAGAHSGALTIAMASAVGPAGRVFAVEPDPVARRRLAANVELNALSQVTVVPFALGASRGPAVMRRQAEAGIECPTLDIRDGHGTGEELAVDVTTLDALVEGLRVDVVKLDIEGFEAEALRGAAALLAAGRTAFVLENNEPLLETGGALESPALAILRERGYRVFGIPLRPGPRVEYVELPEGADPRPLRQPNMSLNLVAVPPGRTGSLP